MSRVFETLVAAELAHVRNRHTRPLASHHEAYGVLAEEVQEFFEEVCRRPSKRDPENTLRELVQIATVCQRAAEDLGLLKQA